jgi:hypothetical protein
LALKANFLNSQELKPMFGHYQQQKQKPFKNKKLAAESVTLQK